MTIARPSVTARRWGTAVAVLAALAPLVFWVALPGGLGVNEGSDYRDFYAPVARNILAGRGPVLGDAPAIAYPPGYPFLLAGVSALCLLLRLPESVGLAALAVGATSLSAWLLYRLASEVWGAERALLAAGAWVSYPLALWLGKQPNSEVPFTALLYAGVLAFWLALRLPRPAPTRYFAAGVLLGVAMLVRSIAILVVPVLAVALTVVRRDLPRRTRAVLTLALVAGNLLAVAPWLGWVRARTGRMVPLATTGLSSIRDGLTFGAGAKPYRETAAVPDDVRTLMQRLRAREDEMQSLGAVARVVVAEARATPVAAARFLAVKMARSWYGTDSGRHERAVLAVQTLWMGLALVALARAWGRPGAPRALALVVTLVVLYFWTMTAVVLSVVRYMVPATGLMFAFLPALLPPVSSSPRSR